MKNAKHFSDSVSEQRDGNLSELRGDELCCSVLIDHVNNRLLVIVYHKCSTEINNGEAMDFQICLQLNQSEKPIYQQLRMR